ncbi:MAG: NAD(+) diphosphatase, partial [Christensenellaceae bacterium]|nr:NAD(+) diphosphatase [Christensenellaceae bacterium]
GFSQSLLLGFTAELDGSPEITVDEKELAEAVWVKREDIAVRYDDFSLTNELITKFKNNE